MVSFPQPTATGFPAPTGSTGGLLFPEPTAFQDPMFGVNPYQATTQGIVDMSVGLPDIAQRRAQQEQLAQMASLANIGLAPDSDPHTWTPEMATEQTDNAIAKIAAVNPEAAQRLMEQRTPEQGDDGESFWGNLKDVAGDILSPGLELGGRILDVVSRTANIVPNIAFDMADGGDVDVFGDVGQALTGETRHNWNSVFQEMGWEGDGVGGFLRATIGLAGDIGTDPLTWLIPAGAGVHSAEAAMTTAKTTGTRASAILEKAGSLFAETGDDLAVKLDGVVEQAIKGARAQGWKEGDDLAERAAGLVGTGIKAEHEELVGDIFTIMDRTYRATRTRSLATFARKGSITLADDSVVQGKELTSILEQVIKNGGMSGRGSTAWSQARNMASSVGGMRLKAAVPFTDLRYISPAIPGSKLITEKTVGAVSRMASGQSGMNRLVAAIGAGTDGATFKDLQTWMEQGFDAALEANPALVEGLRGKFKNLGSMFYSGSEQMGRITAHFGSGASATRAGLAGYVAHAQETEIQNAMNHIIRNVAYDVKMPDGTSVDRQTVLRNLENFLGLSLRKKGATATAEQQLSYARYLDYFPPGLDTSSPEAIAEWFWNVPGNAAVKRDLEMGSREAVGEQVAAKTAADAKLAKYQEVAAGVNPKQRETLDQMNVIWDHLRNEAAKKDASLADVRVRYEQVGKLHPTQASEWDAGSHLSGQDIFIDSTDAGRTQRLLGSGIDEDDVLMHGDYVGVRGTVTSGGGRGASASGQQVRSRFKLAQPIVIDETGDTFTDDAIILKAHEEADAMLRKEQAAVDAQLERPVGSRLSEKEIERKRAQLVTDYLRKSRPEADGIVVKKADGSLEVIAFDHHSVKTVSDAAAHLVQERGFFHRTFTKEARKWLRGSVPRDLKSLMVVEPEVEAYLARATIGMDIDEAEDFIREQLVTKYGAIDLPDQIWETDALQVHEAYVEKTAQAIAGVQTGRASRRMVQLGDTAPALFGKSPRDQKYEWMLDPGLLRSLQSKDTKLTNAILRSVERDAKLMEEQHAQHAKVAEQYGLFAAMLDEALAEGVEVPDRLVMAARRHGATVADAQKRIGEELAGVESASASLRDDLASYQDALVKVKDDPGVGHPMTGEPMRVTDLPDGRQRVLGWHFSESGGLPPAGTSGVEMSSNGFHFGDFDTAMARANIEMDAKGKTIGWRHDQTSWPTEMREQGVNPPMLPNETNEAYMARLEQIEAGPQVEVPVEPDVFYDDVMYPVEAEGRFKGGGQAEPVPSEQDLGLTFTGSARGSSVSKLTERGALQGEGFDGALYANAVEGEGINPSIVVLEPENVVVANGRRAFDEAVEDGKVFRAPDGTVSTKRVAGSRRLTGPQSATEQLDALSARRSELEGLQRSLDEGADDVIRPNSPRGVRHKVDVAQKGEEFQATVGGSYVRARRTAEGDLQVYSTLVDKAQRRQGVGTAMYAKLAKLADGWGGKLVSDELGSRTPEADALWRGMAKKGYRVTEEDGKFILQHESLPSTRAVAASGKSLADATAARALREGKVQFTQGKRLQRLKTQTHNAMAEANKAYTEFHGVRAQVKPALVKVETAGNLGGLTRLQIPGLEGYAMPAYIAEEFHHVFKQADIGGLRESWRRYVMGPWKRWATYRWPGFHVRNFFGAWFNNYLGGVVEHDYVFSWRVNHARDGQMKWADRLVSPDELERYNLRFAFGKDANPTYSDVADLLAEQGIGRANTMAVMGIEQSTEAVAENYRAVGRKNPKAASKAWRKFDDTMRAAGSSVEDFHRVAAWGRGMASTKGDTYGARAFVMMRHGDYADLTEAEDFIRDLVPFYKWMRTNVPYQLRMLAENPSSLTMVNKVERWAYDAQGIDQAEAELQQPEWMKNTFAVPIPSWVPVVGSKDKDALKFAMFDLPYADLYNGLGDYLSSALPVGRNFIESYGIKQQVFSGVPLTGEYKPLSGVFNIPGVRDILHTFGLTKRGEDGQEYMKDQVQNVLMAWPIFSRFRNFTESDPARVDARTGGLFSMIAGVGVRPGDFTQAELDFYYNEIEPLMAQYRSLGITMPTVEDFQGKDTGEAAGLFGGAPVESPFLTAA